jgi:hypothetical protein
MSMKKPHNTSILVFFLIFFYNKSTYNSFLIFLWHNFFYFFNFLHVLCVDVQKNQIMEGFFFVEIFYVGQ